MKIATLAASATLAIAATTAGAVASLPGAPTLALAACDPATHALQFMAAHQAADGSIDGSLAETSDYILAAASDNIDPGTLAAPSGKTAHDYLIADLAETTPRAFKDANQLGKVIQAVVAGHRDPTAFGGRNLLAKLTSTGGSSPLYDGATGRFFDQFSSDPVYNNQSFANAQAILALAGARDATYPVPTQAVSLLKSLRSTGGATSGGWPAFGSFDTNTTSMALMALEASGDTPGNDAALYADAFAFLHTQQDSVSGGFVLTTDFPSVSDPDSDALVIQAVTAAGQDPGGATWSNAGGNAPADILAFQDQATGGLAFTNGGKLQTFATSQAIAGFRRAPFPIAGSFAPGAPIPPAGCAPPAAAAVTANAGPGLPAAGEPAVDRMTGPGADDRTAVVLLALLLPALLAPAMVVAARAAVRRMRRPRE